MSRWKAAAIHLSISALIGIAAAALTFGVWYPYPYSQAMGAKELVVLLLGVDLVLGPLLTLVVFRSGKRNLRLDLAVIGALQLCALIYGLSIVANARLAFIVGTVDRLVLVPANVLDANDLAAGTRPEFQTLSFSGPRLVGAAPPADQDALKALMVSGAAGKDVDKFPKYYVDYSVRAPVLLRHTHGLDELVSKHAESALLIDAWLQQHAKARADVVWLPLTGTRSDMSALLDRESGALLGALPVDPW